MGPPRTVRRARRTVARALRRRRPPRPRSPAAFASSRSMMSASARVRRTLAVASSPTYSACPSRRYRASASVGAHFAHSRHVSARRPPPCRSRSSVDTSMAGFGGWPHRPGGRTTTPAAREVGARRLAANTRCLFNAPERPPQPAQRDHLLSFLGTQDHSRRCPSRRQACSPPPSQRLGARRRVGRFSGVDQWPVLGVDRGPARPARARGLRGDATAGESRVGRGPGAETPAPRPRRN